MKNQIEAVFPAYPENEALARMIVSAFMVQADPAFSVISEVRTAVSEAVTNAVVHAYNGKPGKVFLRAFLNGDMLEVEIEDMGRGIQDVQQAMTPFFTTEPEKERTGMGFALMQSFMDRVTVQSLPGCGTSVRLTKKLNTLSETSA